MEEDYQGQRSSRDNQRRITPQPDLKPPQITQQKILRFLAKSISRPAKRTHRSPPRLARSGIDSSAQRTWDFRKPLPGPSKNQNKVVSQLQKTQRSSSRATLQDGIPPNCPTDHENSRLCHPHRYQVSIPPHLHIPQAPAENMLHRRATPLAIRSNALRTEPRALHMDKNLFKIYQAAPKRRYQMLLLYGRTDHFTPGQRTLSCSHTASTSTPPRLGHHTEPRQVDHLSHTTAEIPGLQHQPGKEPSLSSKRKAAADRKTSSQTPQPSKMHDQRSSSPQWQAHSSLSRLPTRQETPTVPSERHCREHRDTPRLGPFTDTQPSHKERPQNPQQHRQDQQMGELSPHHRPPRSHLANRRLAGGLGRSLHSRRPNHPDLWTLESTRERQHFELERNQSNISLIPGDPPPNPDGSTSSDSIRLHHSPGIREKNGRADPSPFIGNRSIDQIIDLTPPLDHHDPRSWQREHSSGQTVQKVQEGSRLVDRANNLQPTLPPTSNQPHDRHLRRPAQHKTPSLHFLETRSLRSPNELPLLRPSDGDLLCMSPIPNDPITDHSSLPNPRSMDDACNPSRMEGCDMVASLERTFNRPSGHITDATASWSLQNPSPPRQDIPVPDSIQAGKTISDFLDNNAGPSRQRQRTRQISRYKSFLQTRNLTDSEINLLEHLRDIFTTAPSQVQPSLSSIDHLRAKEGLPRFQDSPRVKLFMQAIKKQQAKKKRYLSQPDDCYDPRPLLRKALQLGNESLTDLRTKVIIILRTIALMRSSDIAHIYRSSIRTCTDISGRQIVSFSYTGKKANLTNIGSESNYIEFTNLESDPAAAILALKTAVDSLNPPHDHLIPNITHPKKSISSQRISKITTEFMTANNIDKRFKAHSIRAMTSEILTSLNVPANEIEIRGGWSHKSELSAVRRAHYRSKIVPTNFAITLLARRATIRIPKNLLNQAITVASSIPKVLTVVEV